MKIVHIIGTLSPGGAETLVKDLSIIMSKNEIVEIWALTSAINKEFETNYINELKNHGIKCIIIGKRPKKDKIKTIFLIASEIRKSKPDIINSHLEGVSLYSILANIIYRVPLIQTIHNTKLNYKFAQRLFMQKFCDKYVAISNGTETLLKDKIKINPDKVIRIENGICLEKFKFDERIIEESVNNIIAIGRINTQKGFDVLLKGYKILKLKLNNERICLPQLCIVGQGELMNELIELTSKLELNDCVKFLGVREDINELLKKSDIYIMSSRWEGLSISLIEAVASKIPIIATNVGGNNEIIKDNYNGILINSEDEIVIANTLYNLIKNKIIREKYSNNCTEIIDKFNLENCSKKYLNLYSTLKLARE